MLHWAYEPLGGKHGSRVRWVVSSVFLGRSIRSDPRCLSIDPPTDAEPRVKLRTDNQPGFTSPCVSATLTANLLYVTLVSFFFYQQIRKQYVSVWLYVQTPCVYSNLTNSCRTKKGGRPRVLTRNPSTEAFSLGPSPSYHERRDQAAHRG